MPNVAILVGNTEYRTIGPLACCDEDLAAIKELIEATGKFQIVEIILNQDSSQLKDRIRATVDAHSNIEEIFSTSPGMGTKTKKISSIARRILMFAVPMRPGYPMMTFTPF